MGTQAEVSAKAGVSASETRVARSQVLNLRLCHERSGALTRAGARSVQGRRYSTDGCCTGAYSLGARRLRGNGGRLEWGNARVTAKRDHPRGTARPFDICEERGTPGNDQSGRARRGQVQGIVDVVAALDARMRAREGATPAPGLGTWTRSGAQSRSRVARPSSIRRRSMPWPGAHSWRLAPCSIGARRQG